jgi:recombinational DNA repair protein (RecF pathway)
MAGVLDEYDEPTPVKAVYCRQLTEDQYDEEGASYTHEALKDLVKYLDKNPQAYGEIMKKRRKEEAENAGFLSYFKVKLFGYFGGEDSGFDTPSKAECLKEVDKVKKNMMNVYSYSQGQCRRSVRIAERRKKLNTSSYSPIPFSLPQAPPPPPPAPPPPPPPPPVAPPPKPFQPLTVCCPNTS